MAWNGSHNWLSTVPPEAVLEIRQVVGSLKRGGTRERETGRWWVRLTPTTGPADNVTLIEKNSFGATVRRWQIMERGELVSTRDELEAA